MLIQKDAKGYLVQDFYQDTQAKQTDPFYLKDQRDIASSAAHSIFGALTEYFPNGKVHVRAFFQENKQLMHASFYDAEGSLLHRIVKDASGKTVQESYWHSAAQKALALNYNDQGQVLQALAWTAQGAEIPAESCFAEGLMQPEHEDDACYQLLLHLDYQLGRIADQQNEVK